MMKEQSGILKSENKSEIDNAASTVKNVRFAKHAKFRTIPHDEDELTVEKGLPYQALKAN